MRREAVFSISLLLAAISAFIVPPSKAYLAYFDVDTLLILFALMAVIAALRSCDLFEQLGLILCQKFDNLRALSIALIFMVFFSSMLITNDVALITFVPFTLAILGGHISGRLLMLLVILETIAANTGSMLTPLGNPQNLYLYEQMGLGLLPFVTIILPYTLLSGLLLFISALFIPKHSLATSWALALEKAVAPQVRSLHLGRFSVNLGKKELIVIYSLLFLLAILAVLRLVPKIVAAAVTLAVLLIFDKKVLKTVDYFLLLTFVFFFIFTGNLAALNEVHRFFAEIIGGHEFLTALLTSQVISNVPATLLLYPFAADKEALLLGVDVGGLGTLVASLASLISYKYYAAAAKKMAAPSGLQYLAYFTLANLLALGLLMNLYYFFATG